LPGATFAETNSVAGRPTIYDVQADGKAQIADALAEARKEHKRVLLQFGANWCGWCHRLHRLFRENEEIKSQLSRNYVVVMIDVDKVAAGKHNEDVDEKYGHPTQFGLPVLVLLDESGKALVTQDTGKLEEGDHHDPTKVLEFLKKWAPPKS